MYKRRVNLFFCGIIIAAGFCGCVSASVKNDNELLNYNHDLLMAILWQQNSGEYSALCYQAFNAGKAYITSLPSLENKAVVFDIDETVLDNSEYAAWMVVTGNPWGNDTWEAWCNAGDAYPVPGSVDFAAYLAERGVEMFYVSNRPDSTVESTIANLKKFGFPQSDSSHVFLQKDTSDKNPRLERIRALGYEIVLFAGDNLDDFDSAARKLSNQERRNRADSEAGSFGTYRIVLPNAAYGTFESAIVQNYYGLSMDEKARSRLKSISAWEP
jgi:5'-nucleotidase (lipoprotein e(P4) family)